jgi:hypothetical protein
MLLRHWKCRLCGGRVFGGVCELCEHLMGEHDGAALECFRYN